MDAKEYLRRPNRIRRDIIIQRGKAEALRENVLPKGVSFDKEKVQSVAGDKMANYVARLEEIEGKLEELTEEYFQAINDVERVIYLVDNEDACEVLVKRYIERKPWIKIETEMEYMSRATVYRAHRTGLRAVTKILAEEGENCLKLDTQ